jgi:protein SCO1
MTSRHRRNIRIASLLACAAVLACSYSGLTAAREPIVPDEPLPSDSLYQLPLRLVLSEGTQMSLAGLLGKPTIITMFYTSCDGVCPMIAFSMRRMEKELTAQQRARLQWVMVSFDPKRDTPQALSEFARLNQIERPGWYLACTDESGVRDLAAVLAVRYRELPGGAFSHSTQIILLDARGVIRARTADLNELDTAFVAAVRKELQ